MRHGVALREAVDKPSATLTLPALDAWTAKAAKPDLFPIWSRWDKAAKAWTLDRALLAGLRSRGVEPIIYVESTGVPYDVILTGAMDTALRLLACAAGNGTMVRFDQEPNGSGLRADWQKPNAANARWVDVFRHVSHAMRIQADVRMVYCPVGRNRARIGELAAYWPGDDAVQVMAFDMYSNDEHGRFPPEQWAVSIEWQKATAPEKPRITCETGRDARLTQRAEWLASIDDVADLDAAIVFDMGVPEFGDDWRFSRAMYRTAKERW